MNLAMPAKLALGYNSTSQQARVVTQAWARENLYCGNCASPRLDATREGAEANDLSCPTCAVRYELKSMGSPIGHKVLDSGFDAMMRAIRAGRTPSFVLLQYERPAWVARNLLLIPSFAFPESAIERRNPLRATARRHGHVLCNILLRYIPNDFKIPVVANGVVIPEVEVRLRHSRARHLVEGLTASQRGWTLDVLRVVQSLNKREFTNADMYAFERHFEELHPDNRHVRDKIRQQLQVLRDRGFLYQTEPGAWTLRNG
jgi:type II restriction enzyme